MEVTFNNKSSKGHKQMTKEEKSDLISLVLNENLNIKYVAKNMGIECKAAKKVIKSHLKKLNMKNLNVENDQIDKIKQLKHNLTNTDGTMEFRNERTRRLTQEIDSEPISDNVSSSKSEYSFDIHEYVNSHEDYDNVFGFAVKMFQTIQENSLINQKVQKLKEEIETKYSQLGNLINEVNENNEKLACLNAWLLGSANGATVEGFSGLICKGNNMSN